jgi:hypothetical protein
VPQLMFKGGILNAWKKKMAVAIDEGFFDTLPELKETDSDHAEIAWLIYNLKLDKTQNKYLLEKEKTVYTIFNESLDKIAHPNIGPVGDFVEKLQEKLDEKLESTGPEIKSLDIGDLDASA